MSEAGYLSPGQGYRKGLPLHLLGCNLATARDAIPVPQTGFYISASKSIWNN